MVPLKQTDEQAYGDTYQWGRAADGHQIISRFDGDGKTTSATTTTLSSSDQPGHGEFIRVSSSPFDWRSPQNNNLWQGVNGVNNPCPSGYCLPTEAEWEAERNSWSSSDAAGAFASPLKLPVAGYRDLNIGLLGVVGSFGFYWSGTFSGSSARNLAFGSDFAGMPSNERASGYSIRCLKDTSD